MLPALAALHRRILKFNQLMSFQFQMSDLIRLHIFELRHCITTRICFQNIGREQIFLCSAGHGVSDLAAIMFEYLVKM